MNISWLEDFLALAAAGNFSRAAEDRHMTQPAFGRRVRALEEWLGVELFDRRTQPVRLTECGQWFLGVAPELLAHIARLPGAARAMAESHSKNLRLAATHALSLVFMPGWLRRFEEHTMAGNLHLESVMFDRCEELLAQNKVQFVLCHAHPLAPGQLQQQGYESICVGQDKLIPVCARGPDGQPQHLLERPGTVAALLAYSAESGLGSILHCRLDGPLGAVPTQAVFTAHLASVLRSMALEGRGIAWLPHKLIADDLATGRLMRAAGPKWDVELEIRLYRAHAQLGRTADALWQAAVQSVAVPAPKAP